MSAESTAGGLGQQHRVRGAEAVRAAGGIDPIDATERGLPRDPDRGAGRRGRAHAGLHRQRLHEPRAPREHPAALRPGQARA